MTDTPSDAAIDKADTLAAGCGTFRQAFALYIDEVDRKMRDIVFLSDPKCDRAVIARSLMLPAPPDPDEELAREKIMAIWSDGTPDRERVIAVFAEALREQGG